jgi:CDP-diacylglycerol--glycerol-3-phosphate 3-phosphatidyltransferase
MTINLPTKLTLSRVLLVPIFLAFIVQDQLWTRIVALVLFIIASLTDLYDGRLARRYKQVTVLGTFLDPLADKLLISAAFIVFVQVREFYVPAWMIVLIIGREFLITGLRTLAVARGRVIPAAPAGKFKTTSQLTTIITTLVIMVVNQILKDYFHLSPVDLHGGGPLLNAVGWFLNAGPYCLTLLTTILTIVSGYIYIHSNVDLFNEPQRNAA